MLALDFCGKYLLHIRCWLHIYAGSFSYTSRMGFIFILGVSLTHPCLLFVAWGMGGGGVLNILCFFSFLLFSSFFLSFFLWGVSLRHSLWLALFVSGEFLLHIPCWLSFSVGSFSYTSHAVFVFIWGVSLTHPMLAFLFCGEILLHIPC